jgi:hypothetical protein
MLQLAVHVISRRRIGESTVYSDAERQAAILEGRASLRRLTGQDFGYDLASWRTHLLKNEFGYDHPYSFRKVNAVIDTALNDSQRVQLIQTLTERNQRTIKNAEESATHPET